MISTLWDGVGLMFEVNAKKKKEYLSLKYQTKLGGGKNEVNERNIASSVRLSEIDSPI